jgi:hypothetical protein
LSTSNGSFWFADAETAKLIPGVFIPAVTVTVVPADSWVALGKIILRKLTSTFKDCLKNGDWATADDVE